MGSAGLTPSRLALGTVQFGMPYGVANTTGRPDSSTVRAILDEAERAGVRLLDTAVAYGDAESVIGSCVKETSSVRVVTKLPPGCRAADVRRHVENSCARLGRRPWGVLMHDAATSRDAELVRELAGVADEYGFRFGLSAYRPEDVEDLLSREPTTSLVQVPYSAVDRRFETRFEGWRARGVQIHTRSALLQGLLTLPPAAVPESLSGLRASVGRLHAVAAAAETSPAALALAFAVAQEGIDAVVVGVETVLQLRDNLALFDRPHLFELATRELRDLAQNDEHLILPNLWNLG